MHVCEEYFIARIQTFYSSPHFSETLPGLGIVRYITKEIWVSEENTSFLFPYHQRLADL